MRGARGVCAGARRRVRVPPGHWGGPTDPEDRGAVRCSSRRDHPSAGPLRHAHRLDRPRVEVAAPTGWREAELSRCPGNVPYERSPRFGQATLAPDRSLRLVAPRSVDGRTRQVRRSGPRE